MTGWRQLLLVALVTCGVTNALLTELLSALRLLRPAPVLAGWTLGLLLIVLAVRRWRPRLESEPAGQRRLLDAVYLAGIAIVVAVTGLVAVLSPPNSHDVLAYHMPRIVYWAQSASVSFYPTHYLNQIMMPPLTEYFMLHTFVLSGRDHWVNLVSWVFFAGSLAGVSLLAREFGAGYRGQVIAALFAATLPSGILHASAAKNEWSVTFWLVALAWFGIRFERRRHPADLLGMSAALALALFTKGTAYIYAPAVLAGVLAPSAWRQRRYLVRALPVIAVIVLIVNGPQYWRNIDLCGSPLGCDSAHGDGQFRWRNEPIGIAAAYSNALRHLSEQLGGPSAAVNEGIYEAVLAAHRWAGLDPNDPSTTWRWTEYRVPVNSNHEADAGNRWHLLLLAAALVSLWWRPRNDPLTRILIFSACLLGAFLLFCLCLKWTSHSGRLFLALFVLAAPFAGLALERLRPAILPAAVCIFLLAASRPYLEENWLRRLTGPGNLFEISREEAYFTDMGQYNNRLDYLRAAELTVSSGCREVGIDTGHFSLEYPCQTLLQERDPGIRFQHLGVTNQSAKYWQSNKPEPCAVLCLDCAGDNEKLLQYSSAGAPIEIGKSLLFLSR